MFHPSTRQLHTVGVVVMIQYQWYYGNDSICICEIPMLLYVLTHMVLFHMAAICPMFRNRLVYYCVVKCPTVGILLRDVAVEND